MGRLSTLVLACFLPCWVLAQPRTTHLLELIGPSDAAVAKMAHTKVLTLDPHAVVSFQGSLMKVRLDEEVTTLHLMNALNEHGEVVRIADGALLPADRSLTDPRSMGGSANDEPGEAELRAAKAAWLLANPGGHQRPDRTNSQPHE